MRNLTSRQKILFGVYAMILAMIGDYLLGFRTFSTSSAPDAYMGITFNVVPDWRYAVSSILGFVCVPLFAIAALELLRVMEIKYKLSETGLYKLFKIANWSGILYFSFIHIGICMLPVVFNAGMDATGDLAASVSMVVRVAKSIAVPMIVGFIVCDLFVAVAWIDGISVQIPEKTTTAIVGPSGGGKTTLVNLLARFWDTDAGKVTLGGRDVKEYDMDSLMENFSFVFQNVYLFHDTIVSNIRFGQPDAPMENVIEAAKKACCHEFIEALPEGYETVIGEGGASLSGGEKQRISIARAMMKDAPVIFLDEATANADPENENDLMRAIEALTAEKTVIMIAHRLKTVVHADQILVVDRGRVVQQGNHEELMEEDGIYRSFISERREAASWKVKASAAAL